MLASDFSIHPQKLWNLLATPLAPQIVDVRRRDVYESVSGFIPGSVWREPTAYADWIGTLDRMRPVVVTCKLGKELSQVIVSELRGQGYDAAMLAGGQGAWADAGLPLINRSSTDRLMPRRPSLWVTRRHPKIDRIACPWLIRRFIDPAARFVFVDPPYVADAAANFDAIPFDIDGVEISHRNDRCSFGTLLDIFGLANEPSLARLALIVRGADTARHDLAPEASGLHAISLGLSTLARDDDHGLLDMGFTIYDSLFAWLRFAADEKHNWPSKVA
ncbi:chromate resistance protein ChrB domain-containing protein [Undibacter mobilis]|uniref:Sulfurtransferase n=1 Tax=Undibacter mobilis TaxID=2292256 RepID=A0A371BDR6_9BRAD|nr:chromate resistance protein ChrB domain-containing protein [Undibacter mobilis]RDV05756.1 sulfurtransferase [Undibacter mobilis]